MVTSILKERETASLERANVLGSPGSAAIITRGAWKTRAKVAYLSKRDQDALTRKHLALLLINTLEEMLGEDLSEAPRTETSITVDELRFSIRQEQGRQDGRDFSLWVAVKCPFCERDNECEFSTLVELGAVMVEPTGDCQACAKPLKAGR